MSNQPQSTSMLKRDDPYSRRGRRHRVAMVCDFFHPRLGGVENHIWSLSQHLIRQGHSVIVITHAYEGYSGVHFFETSHGIQPLKVYYCPILPMVDQDALPTFTATLPLLRWIFIREQINIVHSHQATSTMANEAVVYASLMGLKSVYTDHSLFGFDDIAGVVLNRVLQTTLCTVNAAIAVSHACMDNLILRAHLKPPDNRVSIIPNAIDATKFTPDPSQRPTNNRIQVVVVSRLVYRKGVDLLVGIIPQVCHDLPHVDFLIGGDGSKLLDLQEMVERERLEERVKFLGAVPHKNVRNVLVQGHVFLNCSLTESFCIAILEAASTGLLVVSTNVGGVPEVLPPELIRLAPPSVPALVEQLTQAVAQQQGPHALNAWQVHERIQSMYSWSRVAAETIHVYDEISLKDDNDGDQGHSLQSRVSRYYHALDGGLAGMVVALLAIILSGWLRIVEWWQPRSQIDVVPDVWAKTSTSSVPDADPGNEKAAQESR